MAFSTKYSLTIIKYIYTNQQAMTINNLLGLSISSGNIAKKENFDIIKELHFQNKVNWVQIYIAPGTEIETFYLLKDTKLKYIIHAAHELHKFNPIDGLTKNNKEIIDKAIFAASFLKANFVIFHPGFQNYSHLKNSNIKNSFKNIFLILNYIQGKTDKIFNEYQTKPKILFENLPSRAYGHTTLFNSSNSKLLNLMKYNKMGVCLDIANLATKINAQLSKYHFPKELASRKKNHSESISDFLKLGPQVIHTRPIPEVDILERPTEFGKLNEYQLDYILPYCIKEKTPLILEIPQNEASFKSAIGFIETYYNVLSNYSLIPKKEMSFRVSR